MIVIPRKEGESIVIGDEIIVTVIEVQDDHVRVSIERLPSGPDDEAEITDVVLEEAQAPTSTLVRVATLFAYFPVYPVPLGRPSFSFSAQLFLSVEGRCCRWMMPGWFDKWPQADMLDVSLFKATPPFHSVDVAIMYLWSTNRRGTRGGRAANQ